VGDIEKIKRSYNADILYLIYQFIHLCILFLISYISSLKRASICHRYLISYISSHSLIYLISHLIYLFPIEGFDVAICARNQNYKGADKLTPLKNLINKESPSAVVYPMLMDASGLFLLILYLISNSSYILYLTPLISYI